MITMTRNKVEVLNNVIFMVKQQFALPLEKKIVKEGFENFFYSLALKCCGEKFVIGCLANEFCRINFT